MNKYDDGVRNEVVEFHLKHGKSETLKKYPNISASTIWSWVDRYKKMKVKKVEKPIFEQEEPKKKKGIYKAVIVEEEAKAPTKKKIYLICSEDAESIIDILKGI